MSRLEEEGRRLVTRLGGRWGDRGGLCRCPAHQDRTPSLSVRLGRTRLLFHCFAGCTSRVIIDALTAGWHLEPSASATSHTDNVASTPPNSEGAQRLWLRSRPIGGTTADRYLAARGVACDSPVLRFNPRTPFGRHPLTIFAPALIAAVHDDNGMVAVHRTRVDRPPHEVPAAPPRKAALGALGAGAVRLVPAAACLGLAEGIEDALSATALTGVPCWATLGAARFGRIALPPGIRQLVLFLDHDEGGRRAEQLARGAYGGRIEVIARYASRWGRDWNDDLRDRVAGAHAGPGTSERKGGG